MEFASRNNVAVPLHHHLKYPERLRTQFQFDAILVELSGPQAKFEWAEPVGIRQARHSNTRAKTRDLPHSLLELQVVFKLNFLESSNWTYTQIFFPSYPICIDLSRLKTESARQLSTLLIRPRRTLRESERSDLFIEGRIFMRAARLARSVLLLLSSFFTILVAPPTEANVIFVTTSQQKIGGPGGCSLQEAILSANQDTSAFLAFGPTGNEVLINSACTAGSGDDIIVLPTGGALFPMNAIIDDANNPTGPTATPIITSTITIQGNGATLQWVNANLNARAFAVGTGGNLTLSHLFVTGFVAKGGDGAGGGGGGMGAGGAIYVEGGSLTVIACTFDRNAAVGGSGSPRREGGGGGGGISGKGGLGAAGAGGGGGGGARGAGGNAGGFGGGAGGGGTLTDGADTVRTEIGGPGGVACGGTGGDFGDFPDDGHGGCDGGGGGGGSGLLGQGGGGGGHGGYGGGGGGGGDDHDGGVGGFGGGGGSDGGDVSNRGGAGGYGGGGGASSGVSLFTSTRFAGGAAGRFAGRGGNPEVGGGGAGLGGAVFSHSGAVTIQNSTFFKNSVIRGNGATLPAACDSSCIAADNGQDEGGAIFAVDSNLTVENSTIVGNTSTGEGAGIVVDVNPITAIQNGVPFTFFPPVSFNLFNTIVSNPSARECFYDEHITSMGDGNLIVSDNTNNHSNFLECPGIVTNQPPFLGPLQINLPGIVPTLAILDGVSDPAFNSAAGGLSTDERGIPRPQGGGFDIGAYELCFDDQGPFDRHCENTGRPEANNLTIQVSPSGAGVTSPAEGMHGELPGSLVALTVTANQGFSFIGWTGPVGDPNSASTSVLMSSDETVTANFVAISKTLTVHVSPFGAGTTNPTEGQYSETPGSVVPLTATAKPGYSFVNWSGLVVNPNSSSTSVVMTDSETVTANFVELNTSMAGNIIAKTGPPNARVWTLSLLDNGPGAANAVLINSFTLTQTFGAACTPVLDGAAFPLSVGNVAPLQTGTTTLPIDFTGCAASARFTAKFLFSANNGAVSGYVVRYNQTQ